MRNCYNRMGFTSIKLLQWTAEVTETQIWEICTTQHLYMQTFVFLRLFYEFEIKNQWAIFPYVILILLLCINISDEWLKFYPRIAFEPVRNFFPQDPKYTKMQNESRLLARPCRNSTKYQRSAPVLHSQDILIMFSNCCNIKVSSPCCMCLQLT